MSGEPTTTAPGTIVFNDLRVRGFWLSRYLLNAPREGIDALYRELDALSITGRLVTRIELFPGGFERHVMPGVGHFLHLEAPDKLNAVIAGYLKGAVKQE